MQTFEEIKNQLLNKLKAGLICFKFFYKSLLTKYNLTYENKNLKYFDSY